jgi:hypothetical protein
MAYWIGGGDYARFINRKDRRHRESELAKWLHGKDDIVGLQEKTFIERIVDIREKCLGLAKGNHEDDILTWSERDVYSGIVNSIAMPDRHVRLDVGGFIVIYWRTNGKTRWRMTIFVHHGSGGGLLEGGHALTLGRLPKWYSFDIALLGHRHVKQWVPNVVTAPNATATGFIKRQQHMLFGGTYLDSVCNERQEESYAERRMLPPKGVGVVKLRIRPSSQEIHAIL